MKGNTRNQYSTSPIPQTCPWGMEVHIKQSQEHVHGINDFDFAWSDQQPIQFNHITDLKWVWISWKLKYLRTTNCSPTELFRVRRSLVWLYEYSLMHKNFAKCISLFSLGQRERWLTPTDTKKTVTIGPKMINYWEVLICFPSHRQKHSTFSENKLLLWGWNEGQEDF